MRLVMASANAHKAFEIAQILTDHEIQPRPDSLGEIVEDQETLEGNARLKASVCAEAWSPAVADDTGLEVDALAGLPGVRSARFAGDFATDSENLSKLLKDMQQVPSGQRTARFRTVAVVVFPDGKELIAHGVVEGSISEEPRNRWVLGTTRFLFLMKEEEARLRKCQQNKKISQATAVEHFAPLAQMLNQ